ncbi:MAG TPA: hypothetical protein VJ714_10180 [Anaerolineae bacterium]|nr:hypothetical protein [Anaerolineae bacterium]
MVEDSEGTAQVLVGVADGGAGVEDGVGVSLADGPGETAWTAAGELQGGIGLGSHESGRNSGEAPVAYKPSQLPATKDEQIAATPTIAVTVHCFLVTVPPPRGSDRRRLSASASCPHRSL